MTPEEKFKWAIKDAWQNHGIYPTPTFLNMLIHKKKSNNLNGRETKWRREVMQELKIRLKRPRAREPKILCCMNKSGCRCCA